MLHLATWCCTQRCDADDTPTAHDHGTDDVAAALGAAAKRWPEVGSRRELLLRLVEQGRDVIERDRAAEVERRRAAIQNTSGALTGVYEPGYLERLRED